MKQSKNANRKLLRAVVLFGLLLALASAARAQSADVGKTLDRFLDRVTVAADAASVVVEADKLKREAEQKSRAGQRDEARALLRQAGEMIAAAAPDGDARRDDPLLGEYLRDIASALVALDGAPVAAAPSLDDRSGLHPRIATFVKVEKL